MKKGILAAAASAMLLFGSTVNPAEARNNGWLWGLGGLGLGLTLGSLGANLNTNYGYGGYATNYRPYSVGYTYPDYYGAGYYPSTGLNLYSAPSYYGYYGDYWY